MTHSPDGIRAELFLSDGSWENIISRVRGASGIQISRGRRDERGRTTTSLNLTLEDPDGDFNDLNPLSPYYGLIGPNTQLRVSLGNNSSDEDDFNRTVTNEWNTVLYTWNVDDEGWVGEGATSVARVTTPDNDASTSGSLEATKTLGSGFDSLRFNDNEGLRDISAAGDSLAVWVLVPGGSGGSGWLGHLEVQNPGFTWIAGTDVALTPGTWARLTFTDPGGLFANCRSIGVQVSATGVNASQNVNIDTLVQYSSPTPLWDSEVAGTGVALADFDVNGTHGTHTHPNTNELHYSYTTVGETNQRIRTVVNLSAADVTGAAATMFVLARMTDTSNYYGVQLQWSTAEVVTLQLQKRVAGSFSTIGSAVTVGTYTAAATTPIAVELYVHGSRLYAKAWTASADEPTGWDIAETDTSLTTGTLGGIVDRRETGNTNANLEFRYNEFLAVPGSIRAHVEVPNWGTSRWTHGGRDVTTAIQAAGIKRRLGSASARALGSAVTRYISKYTDQANVVGYWPCEDGEFGGQIASGLDSGVPLDVIGAGAQFGATSVFPGTASMISLGSGTKLKANVNGTNATEAHGRLLVTFPDAGIADDSTVMAIFQTRDSAIRKWYLQYQQSTGGSLRIVGYDQDFALTENSGYIAFNLNGKTAQIQMRLAEDGADVDWEIAVDTFADDGRFIGTFQPGTFTTSSVGAITGFAVAPEGAMDGCSVGQISVSSDSTSLPSAGVAASGHVDESAATRFARLCDEEGIAYEIVGESGNDNSMQMGPQRIATLVQNLEDIEDADQGIVYEPRHFLGLVLRLHYTLANQTGPNFTYTSGFLTGEPFPEPDDLLIANDVTVSRYLGGKYQSIEDSGIMSVSNIGRYLKPVNANVSNNSALPDVARWHRHLGTWRSARYPTITFEPHRSQFTASITADVDELDIGDYFSIGSVPTWLGLGSESIEQLVQGYTEAISNKTRKIQYNCIPAGPYKVAVRGTTFRRDSLASTLSSSAASGATSLSVAVTGPLWTTGTVDFNIMVSGSVKHVTNISGASSPQTFTVDASAVNGIDKALAAGDEVHIYPRAVRGLTRTNLNLAAKPDADDTFVTGVDTPPAVWAEGDTTGTFTSATFSAGTDPVGVVYRLPHSGSVAVHIAAELNNDSATGFTIMSWELRTGPVIGEGSLLLAADDSTGILVLGTDGLRTSKTFIVDNTLTGTLDPGKEFNIQLKHRRVTAGNASIKRRMLLVRPVRTQGGLPGSLIDNEPQAEDDFQDASDTSTSLTYTTADMTACGAAIVAPPSGKALIGISARMDHSAAAPTFVSFEVREGNVVGSGTVFLAASDSRAIMNHNVNQTMGGASFVVTGMTAGSDYNVQMMHRTTSGTLTLQNRVITIEPVT